jgi:hypothetical protein
MREKISPSSTGWRLRMACLAAAALAALTVAGCSSSGEDAASIPTIIEANIDTQAAAIGGATTAVAYYDDGTSKWTLYSMANRLASTRIGMAKDTVTELTAPGYIQHIRVVGYGGKQYALLSMGGKGMGVVDITNPAAMVYLRTMTVDYMTPAFTYSDGGGTVFTEAASTLAHTAGPVNDLLVDDKGTLSDQTDDELFIANGAFGIQKTKLSNLMGATADGSLPIDGSQTWTLKYAGENPWGGPLSLTLHGGKLYAALGFLGIGIYDPATLTRTGAYNLYADCANRTGLSVGQQEDWFGYPQRKIVCPASTLNAATNVVAGGVDADGMPTYLQAAFELDNKNGHTWYPWAEFDRYGKYYYNARGMELVDLPAAGAQPARTVAYIAYSLAGLVAVDVTDPATPAYEGYIPAAPAHGPNEPPINVDKKGILSHFGSGMLKEAGVMDVRVVPDTDAGAGNYRAFYTDHFAGLVVVSGAEQPATQWKSVGSPFNNDTIDGTAEPRVFWPDYEFVKSFDMTPVPVGDESMPAFLVGDAKGNYPAPVQLVSGEINGHGGGLFLMPTMNVAAAGQVDLVESSGAGGVSFVDISALTGTVANVTERFAVPVNLVSTNEVGALESGAPGQPIAIGHAEGVTVSGNHLYLADGPHGVSVWRIADGLAPIDDLHLVANTLQSEYPTGVVMPTPHAFKVAFGADPNQAYVMSQSLGMRRLNVSAVTGGSAKVGAPALLDAAGNIFEHNTEAGNVGLVKITGQDHAYGVTFAGKYAIVADGDNGLTVYDTSAVPGSAASVVANIGDSADTASGKPPVGRAATVKLWTHAATSKTYAVVAAGAYGISVVDMTAFLASGNGADLTKANLIKTFEPLKSDDDNAFGSADGKSVDIHIVSDVAYFSYDSFGVGAYRMADLIAPPTDINPLCTDPNKLSAKQGGPAECRPTLAGYFKLQKQVGYETLDGGALYMTPQLFPANTPFRDATGAIRVLETPKLLFYVAYGDAGVIKLDWSNVAVPQLLAIKGVVGGAAATAINNGRVYVAAGTGGLAVLK